MTHVIAEPCLSAKDRSCQIACPVDCIVDVGAHLAIDPDRCVDCGACVPACPVSAIFPEERLPSEWVDWGSRNREVTRANAGLTAGSSAPRPVAARASRVGLASLAALLLGCPTASEARAIEAVEIDTEVVHGPARAPVAATAPEWPAGCWDIVVKPPISLMSDKRGQLNLSVEGSTVFGTVSLLGKTFQGAEGRLEGGKFFLTVTQGGKEGRIVGARSGSGLAGTLTRGSREMSWTGRPCGPGVPSG